MAACPEIEDLDDVNDELFRVRHLLVMLNAACNGLSKSGVSIKDAEQGFSWIIGDLEDDLDRIIASVQKINESG